ncbi:MAG: hypothetical protein WC156_05750 [Pedobacter sp.]
MTRKTGNYDEYHLEWLKDPENAAAFLNAVIEDNDREAFLLALRDVSRRNDCHCRKDPCQPVEPLQDTIEAR